MNRSFRRTAFICNRFFNNVKILSVTFDQYNAFLLNKMISFFKKNLADPKLLNS